MNENLAKAFEILYSHRVEVESFMNYYVFKKMNINKETFLYNENDFLLFIDFCLNTAQKTQEKNIKDGLNHFKVKYKDILRMIENKDIEKLKWFVYNSQGVGQKIGSMMLEFIYLYSDKKDENIARKLFVPLDTHVIRIFEESFNIKNIPANFQLKIENKNFIDFQKSLEKYTGGKPIIYFDYLWFIGKMFCSKITDNKSKGYKLCNYCWIKECCENKSKWI